MPILERIRQGKKTLFALLGFIGGAIGAVIAEPIVFAFMGNTTSGGIPFLLFFLSVIIWTALLGMAISLSILWAMKLYQRAPADARALLKEAALPGIMAGAVSGAITQGVYSFADSGDASILLFHIGSWIILGALLGLGLSRRIANMSAARAFIAGAIGGFFGGLALDFIPGIVPETVARILGVGILGAALGLSLIIVEERLRQAYLEVHWGPYESSEFTLGNEPITVGGGTDDIFIYGEPEHALAFKIDGGKVVGTSRSTGERWEFADGTSITIEDVKLVVRMRHPG